jgi:hypothetical protein
VKVVGGMSASRSNHGFREGYYDFIEHGRTEVKTVAYFSVHDSPAGKPRYTLLAQ